MRRQVAGRIAAGAPEERFDIRIAEDLPQQWADPDKIDQVLANLLENAVRHGEGLSPSRWRRQEIVEAATWEHRHCRSWKGQRSP